MKLNQLFNSAMFLLITVALSSCSGESLEAGSEADGATTQIRFSISMPKGDPVIYSRAIHDAEEWGIESLWLYEFDANTGKLLANAIDIKSTLQGTGPSYEYSQTITTANKASRRFVFVANEQVPGITTGSTLAQLQALLATKALATSSRNLLNTINAKQRIPMTGEAKVGNSSIIVVTGATQNVRVDMTRIVARIDVTNSVPNFRITSLKLNNVNSASYLFPAIDASGEATFAVPATSTKINAVEGFNALPSPSFDMDYDDGSGRKGVLTKAFYLYEGAQATEADAMSIQVGGKLGGVDVIYNIPFWKAGAGITVKRNHIYRLILGDGITPAEPNTMVAFTIEYKPWNELLLNEGFNIIELTRIDNTDRWDDINHIAYVQKYYASRIRLSFNTKFEGHTTFVVNAVGSPSWISIELEDGGDVLITHQPNDTGTERIAIVEVSSNVNPSVKYKLQIKQAG